MAPNLHSLPVMSTEKKGSKGEDAKHEAEKSPGRDDVHEQREPDQKKEGITNPSGG